MQKSLLKRVPGIVAKGRQQAKHILENLQGRHRATLQTREWVLSANDSAMSGWIKAGERRRLICGQTEQQPNCLIHGDNLPAMAALLVGDDAMPSLRGKIDLIHIDAPFGSGADDRTETASQRTKQRRVAIRQFACSDEWTGTVASYLEMLAPRLILMRELLSSNGVICMCPDWRVRQYAKLVMDEVFGAQNLLALEWLNQEILLAGKEKAPDSERYRNIDGMRCPDAWTAFPAPPHNENIGAKAEKPAFLLALIILASTNPESIVADFFGGAGNTAAIAERLGRRWIISDTGGSACMGIRNRLANQNAKPFLYQAVGDDPAEAA
jgi:adenine-specific DNA-methyltransferase